MLGGGFRWGFGGVSWLGRAAIALLIVVLIAPIRGLYKATGSSLEEGFMLVFPNLVQQGWVPNRDFLHLYGPTSLDSLALWYRVFGDTLESERTFGLLQNLAIVAAIYTLARVSGHVAAVGAALVAAMFVMTPIGLTALAWHGGVALALWATVYGARARATGQPADWWRAAIFAGLALGFRPDLVVALGLTLAFLLWPLRRHASTLLIAFAGLMVGLLPMWWHLGRAGLRTAFEGMVLEPVVDLRPGRELPAPPSWDKIDGALQAVAEEPAPRWWLPAPQASHQLYLWFWAVVIVAIGTLVFAAWRYRRATTEQPPETVEADGAAETDGDRDGGSFVPLGRTELLPLLAGAVFGFGIIPQALQRPDSAHLAWVAMVSWPILTVLLVDPIRRLVPLLRPSWAGATAATALIGIVMIVICPFYTYRMYALHTRVSIGQIPPPFEIQRGDHRFWVGDAAVARAVNDMIPDLEALMDDGDTLIVGPGDLSRTVYADTYIYWLFPELEPGTRYIEMDPGLADQADSGLAEEIAAADFVVLTNTWSGWYEPNASIEQGSQEHNRAVADHHCLVQSYETNLVLLFAACEGGGGLDPVTIAGRENAIGGGGVESAIP
ncbi:dolichyl-phosphate-mannose-protein mannosyltransferase [Ilumatobacter fluminis]|uniref:Dolichyl-phosphate-mannose-protein mannosyltransferase n=1 Tax=Ilumatobacter fluminis TaxID=467091 RepID=A0A4R7HZE3_9ACTN|nr:dolichyl-phosphate-mannose-protein mannosyltransferase [Ilumatobacter fluminis]